MKKSLILEGKIFSWDFLMTTVLFRFLLVYGRTISVLQFFFINFPKNYFDSESWRKTFGWTGEKNIFWRHFHSIIIYLPFSQYNHIQNFEEKKLFLHFANLIKIRSTHLPPILDLSILFYPCPSVLPKYFSSHFSQQLLMAEIWYLVTSFT